MKYNAVVASGLALLMGAPAFAETSSTDLVVRYQRPQNDHHEALHTTLNAIRKLENLLPKVDLLNSPEGVVKLHFGSAEEAATAREQLENSDDVISVSQNHLYRPALHLHGRIVKAEERLKETFETPFSWLYAGTGIPPVQMPANNPITGADPLAGSDWALRSIQMPAAAPAPGFRSPIITAVIDTGVDYNHEDLIGAMWRNPDNPREVGYDFAHNTPTPYDNMHFDVQGCLNNLQACKENEQSFLTNPGHGTHCAGHVAAVANNSLGIRGIGAGSPVVALKFFYDAGEPNAGAGDDGASIQAIDYAIEHGVKVISASWGGRMPRTDGESSELKQALIRAQRAGVIVVIAAGNDGINQDTDDQPSYPAAYNLDNLIIVAAVDSNDQLASFSNYGAQSVQIAAPGVKILSTTVGSHYADVIARYTDPKGQPGEMDWDGTSMATPIVAGAVAAVWTAHPSENYHQIRDRILQTARRVPGLAGKVSTGGILNVSGALM